VQGFFPDRIRLDIPGTGILTFCAGASLILRSFGSENLVFGSMSIVFRLGSFSFVHFET